jgi:hypothetical protein
MHHRAIFTIMCSHPLTLVVVRMRTHVTHLHIEMAINCRLSLAHTDTIITYETQRNANTVFCITRCMTSTHTPHALLLPRVEHTTADCFLLLVLPPVMIYLAITGGPAGGLSRSSSDADKEEDEPLVGADGDMIPLAPLMPPPGFARLTWYLDNQGVSLSWLWWTGLWAGALFLELNYLW